MAEALTQQRINDVINRGLTRFSLMLADANKKELIGNNNEATKLKNRAYGLLVKVRSLQNDVALTPGQKEDLVQAIIAEGDLMSLNTIYNYIDGVDSSAFATSRQVVVNLLQERFITGENSPVGSVTPEPPNSFYYQTSNGALFQSRGGTNVEWVRSDRGIFEFPDLASAVAGAASIKAGDSVVIAGTRYTLTSTEPSATGPFETLAEGKFAVPQYQQAIKATALGCVGDNTTNNTTALQAAVRKAKHLHFPAGVYVVDAPITLDRPCVITADSGAKIKMTATGNIFNVTSSNVFITNLEFDGGLQAYRAISTAAGLQNFFFQNLVIDRLEGDEDNDTRGIHVGLNCKNIIIQNCFFKPYGEFENTIIGDAGGAHRGIVLDSVENALVQNCHFDQIGTFEDGDFIHVNTGSNADLIWNRTDVTIDSCIFKNVRKRGIKLQASGVRVLNCEFYSGHINFSQKPVAAIDCLGSENIIQNNKVIFTMCYSGIQVTGKRNWITQNNVQIDPTRSFLYDNIGVNILTDAVETVVSDNYVNTSRTGIYARNNYAMIKGNRLGAQCSTQMFLQFLDDSIVTNNLFENNSAAASSVAIRFAGGPLRMQIEGNRFLGGDTCFLLSDVPNFSWIGTNYIDTAGYTTVYNTSALTNAQKFAVGFSFENFHKHHFHTGQPEAAWGAVGSITTMEPSVENDVYQWVKTATGWQPLSVLGLDRAANIITVSNATEIIGTDDYRAGAINMVNADTNSIITIPGNGSANGAYQIGARLMVVNTDGSDIKIIRQDSGITFNGTGVQTADPLNPYLINKQMGYAILTKTATNTWFLEIPVLTGALAAYTADDESVAYTATPAALTDGATLADLNALRAAYENLRAMVEDLRSKL